MSDRTENAAKILDYWYITEFLVQASYEDCTYEDQTIRDLKKYKEEHLGYKIVSYVNTTAAVKALTDVVVTSSW